MLCSHKGTPIFLDALPRAWLDIGFVKRINRAIIRHFQNQWGSMIPTPIMVKHAPKVVHFVPAWRRLYTSGNLNMPRLPRKRNATPIPVIINPAKNTSNSLFQKSGDCHGTYKSQNRINQGDIEKNLPFKEIT